ncbi:MAG: VTT domain-containing protein [Actinobacteria bacterium]|nr:VTT domain-containing protein [Actinomycetota bacterium]
METASVLAPLFNIHSQIVHTSLLNPNDLLTKFGSVAFVMVLAIVFTECGILLGLILPGDSLLFITGMFIASGQIKVNIWVAIALIAIAAIVGNLVGYWLGTKIGPPLLRRPDSRIFKQEYVERTHKFFERHGARAIILARFVPIVRTLITATAGIAGMPFRIFAVNSAIGGVLWAGLLTGAGYKLGHNDTIKSHIELFTLGIVLLSLIPVAFELIKARKHNAQNN